MQTQVKLLSDEECACLIRDATVAVVHFDTEWDIGYRSHMREAMLEACHRWGERVVFAEIDCDHDSGVAKAIPVLNVPTVAYFRNGRLIRATIGKHDVSTAIEQLLSC